MTPVMGVDGCPAGWIAVTWGAKLDHRLVSCFSDLLEGDAVVIAVDMPIGLPQRHGRAPEREVRGRLGERQSSVFAVPARPAVMCEDYRDALGHLTQQAAGAVGKQIGEYYRKLDAR